MTDTLSLPLSADFNLHVQVTHTPLGKHIAFDTQWLGAKDSAATQRQYSVTLTPEQLDRIGQHLKEQA